MGIDGQVVFIGSTNSCQNVGSTFGLRQGHFDFLKGGSSIDSITHLVLLLEHIDFLTIGSDQNSLLHGDGELGLTCDELGNSTLIEDVVHHDILVQGEGHTDDGVVSTQVGVLIDGIQVILELSFSHQLCIFNQSSSVTSIDSFELSGVIAIFGIEVLQDVTSLRQLQGLLGLQEQVNTFIHNFLSNISKAFCISSKAVIVIATAHLSGRLAGTNSRHTNMLLSLISLLTLEYNKYAAFADNILP